MPVCIACGRDNPDDARFCNACGAALETEPRREQRKVVTVLFCDVTGSTALGERIDPEALRALLARYFERMKAIVESHGGTVEKFIGDAVMAVFGVPTLHEDDALRAVRAAAQMRDALPELGLAGRIGVTTGEIVTGTEERLATGDAVNVAARLEQAAQPGEALVGAETLALVRHAVEAEPVEPLALKGKAEPVPAYRLLAVTAGRARSQAVAMVGRTRELLLLREVWGRSAAERSCQLFTILGSAGIGKSRLAAEFLADLDATVVHGRCLSYGEGITYWPVVEILVQLLGTRPAERLQELGLDAAGTAALLGLLDAEGGRPAPPGEAAWAFRKLLEAVAAERLLVCVFDDVHWGEPAFLDLVEHVADLGRDAPLLLLCLARPELYDRRAGWGGGKLNATTVLIEPLSPVETDELIERLGAVDDALRSRIRNAAEGNPLFVEEMLAIVRETADDVAVPPTIQALLAARIDGLAPAERSLLERGAVEGQLFHAGAARALAPDEPAPETLLASLVRRDLIRPAPPIFRGEDAYRFRHILLRDAAYERLPKGRRAELHERLAEWLEAREDELVEADELVGHHLDQAYRYGLELGHADEQVALRAGRRLGAAGSRAVDRWDYLAADGLLQRAFELLPPEQRPLRLWRQRGMNLAGTGRLREAQALTAEAERLAVERGDEIGAERARIAALTVSRQGEGDTDEWRRAALRGIRLFEDARDVEALTEACVLLFWAGFDSLRNAEAIAALEPVLALRQSSGLPAYTGPLVVQLATAHMMSPTPVPAALAFLDEHDAGDATAYVRATLLAMLGRFDEARSAERAAERRARELGERIQEGGTGQQWFLIETLAGDPTAAVPKLRRGCTLLQELEDTGYLSTEAAQLGLALVAQGRDEEAEHWLAVAEEATTKSDIASRILAGRLRAKLLARRGLHEEAARKVAESVALAEGTDALFEHGMTLVDEAEVLALAGRQADAAASLHRAVELFERKQAPAAVALAQARLGALAAVV